MKTTLFFAIHRILVFVVFFVFFGSFYSSANGIDAENKASRESGSLIVPIGVVLDANSPLGAMAGLCMEMAVSDFYEAHPNYTTMLQLHTKNADSLLDANSAAFELVEREKVKGIIGPQGSTEVTLLAELGRKVHVPIISFVSQSLPVSNSDNGYFVRTTPDGAMQAQALAAICRKFEWPEVALLYEDSGYGYQFLSDITKALQEVEIRLANVIAIPSPANDSILTKELNKLKTRQTRIFLVHMSPSIGFQLFTSAKRVGVMSEGYAWLVSDSLSIFMNSMDLVTRDSMEGVIGIRPYVNHSKEVERFQERFKRNTILKNTTTHVMELNAYGLWAYDAVTALATAVERSSFNMSRTTNESRLLKELLSTNFSGLSGEFQLTNGILNLPGFEIFNVVGTGEKTIGFWTPDRGVIREWSSTGEGKELKSITWPGDSTKQPKGWDIPSIVRVGIPWKAGFKEFVDITTDPTTDHRIMNATGFSIDIFLAALQVLPFHINYTFDFYNDTNNINWSYDNMLNDIPKRFDMVVGDTTIWAPRAKHVAFSLPYSDSGVVLVVKNKKPLDMWIFVRPLRWDLWVAIIVACILMGLVLRKLEHDMPNNAVDPIVPTQNEHRRMAYWSPVAVLAFPERNMVSNNWSFFVLVFWLFMAFILMQSYTANLSAILTVDQLKFAFSDNYYIGWQEGSFMKEFLKQQLHINESRLKSYASPKEYHDAMSKGSKNGGIDAIFDEIPYMKIFLNKYDSQYKMVGPTYRTGGFGFAFPFGSPLIGNFSKAILDVTQGSNMTALEQKNFGPGYSSQDPLSSKISQETSSLTLFDFLGLFIIIGSVTIFALFCSETPVGRKLTDVTTRFLHNIFEYSFKSSNENSIRDGSDGGDSREGRDDEDIHEHALNNVGTSSTEEDTNTADDAVGEDVRHGPERINDEARETSLTDETSADQNLRRPIDRNEEL